MEYTHRFRRPPALVRRDLLDAALDLHQINVLVPQLDHALQNGLHLRFETVSKTCICT